MNTHRPRYQPIESELAFVEMAEPFIAHGSMGSVYLNYRDGDGLLLGCTEQIKEVSLVGLVVYSGIRTVKLLVL